MHVIQVIGRRVIAYSDIPEARKGRWWESRIPGPSIVAYTSRRSFLAKKYFNLYPDNHDEFLRELERMLERQAI